MTRGFTLPSGHLTNDLCTHVLRVRDVNAILCRLDQIQLDDSITATDWLSDGLRDDLHPLVAEVMDLAARTLTRSVDDSYAVLYFRTQLVHHLSFACSECEGVITVRNKGKIAY